MDKVSPYKERLKIIQHYLTCLIAFFLCLPQTINPILIACLLVCWILNFDKEGYSTNLRSRKIVFLFVSLYALYAIGIVYSSDMDSALFDMQVKLSVLIFPLIFGASNLISRKKLLELFIFFYAGAFTASVIALANALLIYINTSHIAFFYTEFSIFMHPSYFAMYLVFAVASMAYYLIVWPQELNKMQKNVFLCLIPVFTFIILILQSKAGVISSGITHVVMLGCFLAKHKKTGSAIVATLLIAGIYFFTLKYVVITDYQRITDARDTFSHHLHAERSTKESNRVRIYIWEASLEIIKDNFLGGVGTGDVHEKLNEEYKKRGMTSALEKNLNAHNQFIQTGIALGITGFILLLASLMVPCIMQFKKRQFLLPAFIGIITFNFLFESMLEVQAGVIFYAFFNSLLLFSEESV